MEQATSQRHHLLIWGGPVQETNRIERSYRWWALSAVLLVMFTSAISSTIVSTAVPTIVADLHGFNLYGWVFTGYILASTVTVPIFGKLSDLYGRRPLYLVGIAIFVLGAILAAAAQSMLWLICARVVSGLGGGAMMALSTASIGDIFSPRERGRWMGVVMGVFGLASIVGPTLGGTITDEIGWRYVFLVPLPLAAFAWLIVGLVMPRVRAQRRTRLDFEGSILMTTGLIAVLLAVTWGGTTYAWGSWQIGLCFAAGVALLALFVRNERRAAEPILSPALFANRVFTFSVAISFLIVAGMYGGLSFIPLFVQGVVGKTAQNSGVVLTPMMLSFVAGSALGGQIISRTGRYKVQAIIGMCFALAGFVLFSRLSASSGSGEVIRDMVVLGIGIGTTMPIFSMTVQSAFPHAMLGTVNSGRQLFSNLGGAVAVPVMTAIVVNRFSADLVRYAPAAIRPQLAGANLSPESLLTPQAQAAVQQRFNGFPHGHALYLQFAAALRRALANGIVDVFTVGIGLAAAGLLLTLVFPRIELASWDALEVPETIVEEAGAVGTLVADHRQPEPAQAAAAAPTSRTESGPS
ncbi:MAG: MFS transporter [Thermoleophilia bacterium]|nr:MFS transporter [Thermoleophilia bacterium]